MASLFLDTSNRITAGLLNEGMEWIEYFSHEGLKASKVLHSEIFKMTQKHGVEIKDLEFFFCLTGPGSYTGVRLAQVFMDVLAWRGSQTFSCRHFDLPKLLGAKEGLFISSAFKQEAFVHVWRGSEASERLIKLEAAEEVVESHRAQGVACFTSEPAFYKTCRSTYDLVENRSQEVFEALKKSKMKTDVFYYRELEEEFTKGKC